MRQRGNKSTGQCEPIDLKEVRFISIHDRPSKVKVEQLAKPLKSGAMFSEFFSSLPHILVGEDFRQIVQAVRQARSKKRPVLVALGAHVIKCGLSPMLIQLAEEGIFTGFITHGAGAYHDVELTLFGQTSEDVSSGIESGTFGMAHEPCEFINRAALKAAKEERGLGFTIGKMLFEAKAPFVQHSLFASCARLHVPITVHVAIGTDVNHMHPSFDAAAWGKASHLDFRLLCSLVADLKGGVLFNFGSAVLLPTVIEKAIAVARNLGHEVSEFVGVTFDFLRHYRAHNNPVRRADELMGRGYYVVGHHELMIPLLCQAILDA